MKRHPLLQPLPVLRLLTALSLTSIPHIAGSRNYVRIIEPDHGSTVQDAAIVRDGILTKFTTTSKPVRYVASVKENGDTVWRSRTVTTGKPFIDHNGAGLHDNGARMLDGILCEYISVDPLSDKYPSMSHYVHCADNPLSYIDPDGRKIVAVYDGISYTYRKVGDEYAFYDRDGNSDSGDDQTTSYSPQIIRFSQLYIGMASDQNKKYP